MTRTRVVPERNRRLVEAPKELREELGAGWQDSPAPPMVSASGNASARNGQRRSRLKLLRAIGRVTAIGLALGGLSAGAVLGTYRFAQTSPRFAVSQIVVDGLRHKSRESVIGLSSLGLGANIFSVDTAVAERKILGDPWIRQVKVERRLPGTVRIEIAERDAFALAMLGDQLLLVTRTGETFKKYESEDPVDLPVITGVAVEGANDDSGLERRRIGTALEVLRHYDRSSISKLYPAQEVHLTPLGEVVLIVGKSGVELHLGSGPWAKKLAMAERIFGRLRGQKGNVGKVFLDNRAHPERVVVRMR
ncbi:MAG TPA: FtsQ-type POTRA domain-containing protein [Polyangiaceae bacterium]|nr:FtsQ-type POTRA domain-containing protein [Polyangiaceae bacterium]